MRNEVLATQRSLQVPPSKCPTVHGDRYVTALTLPATSTLFIDHYQQMKRIFFGRADRPRTTRRRSVIGNYRSINVSRRRLIDGTAQRRRVAVGRAIIFVRGVGSIATNLPVIEPRIDPCGSPSDLLSLNWTSHPPVTVILVSVAHLSSLTSSLLSSKQMKRHTLSSQKPNFCAIAFFFNVGLTLNLPF